MKKIALFTALAGLTLVSAAPPSHWARSSGHGHWSGNGYPPCSATVRDRCIQLYERGVATRANLALNEQLGPNRPGVGLAALIGQPQPYAEDRDYAYAEPDEGPAAGDDYAYADDVPVAGDDYAYAGPDEEPMAGAWQDDDEFAAWAPDDDDYGYGEDAGGMY